MAKPLVFQWGDADLEFAMSKVDRSSLYGYKEVEIFDENDRICELATLADDGRTIVGRGGTGQGYLDADGLWRDKATLKPFNSQGHQIEPVPSSFSAPIKLFETATVDEYLGHNIRLIYQLDTSAIIPTLQDELKRGTIFKFPYSFRGGLEANAGFLLMGEDGNLFLTVGDPTKVEFIGLQQAAASDEEEATEETDLMDFGMI